MARGTHPRPRRTFSQGTKDSAVAYAVEHGVNAACRQFDIVGTVIRRWMKEAGQYKPRKHVVKRPLPTIVKRPPTRPTTPPEEVDAVAPVAYCPRCGLDIHKVSVAVALAEKS